MCRLSLAFTFPLILCIQIYFKSYSIRVIGNTGWVITHRILSITYTQELLNFPLYSYWMHGLNERLHILQVLDEVICPRWVQLLCITNLEDVPKGRLQVGHGAVAQGVSGRRGRGQEGRRVGQGRDGELLFHSLFKVKLRIFVIEIWWKIDTFFKILLIHSQTNLGKKCEFIGKGEVYWKVLKWVIFS